MYTTASVFFRTLADVGITHAFVNWGSDHSAFLEDLQRQRAESGGKTLVDIVICPSEYVALSAAHGYASATGKPAAVIVHVDVGTQGLAGAIHNADRGHAPVFIFAGSAPFSANGELPGTKNEFIMWLQDIPDQAAIVRQYMRYTAQIHSGKHVAQTILRALQIATSEPKGPVYLWARREIINEEVDESAMSAKVSMRKWPSITSPALSARAAEDITSALVQAKFPFIIASNVGRDPHAVDLLSTLSSTLAIGTLSVAANFASVPSSHPYYLGYVFAGKIPYICDADVVLIINCDVPWVDALDNDLQDDVKIFVIDKDPLKRTFGWSHVDAQLLCAADARAALSQILDALAASPALRAPQIQAQVQDRRARLDALRAQRTAQLLAAEAQLAPDSTTPSVPFVLAAAREAARTQTPSGGRRVLWLNEAVSNAGLTWNHVAAEDPGRMFMSGGSSLGWVLGASVGASLGARADRERETELVVAVSGDGNYLFALPTAAYWVARRYGTPFLTVILNNRGWFSPKFSMRAVHPAGHGSVASGERLSVGFGQETADYGGVAAAAGGAWARRVERADELKDVMEEAVRIVLQEKRCAVVECIIESI